MTRGCLLPMGCGGKVLVMVVGVVCTLFSLRNSCVCLSDLAYRPLLRSVWVPCTLRGLTSPSFFLGLYTFGLLSEVAAVHVGAGDELVVRELYLNCSYFVSGW